jgi:hypothetical protein
MIPVIINKINPCEFRKYFSDSEQRRVKNHQGVAENLLSPPSMLLALHGTCEHVRRPAPLNDHLSIISNNFLKFYNIIDTIFKL